jgi:hypothetical protein
MTAQLQKISDMSVKICGRICPSPKYCKLLAKQKRYEKQVVRRNIRMQKVPL